MFQVMTAVMTAQKSETSVKLRACFQIILPAALAGTIC